MDNSIVGILEICTMGLPNHKYFHFHYTIKIRKNTKFVGTGAAQLPMGGARRTDCRASIEEGAFEGVMGAGHLQNYHTASHQRQRDTVKRKETNRTPWETEALLLGSACRHMQAPWLRLTRKLQETLWSDYNVQYGH